MLDRIKYAAKLSFIGGSSFFKIFIVGSFSAVFSFAIGLFLFIYGPYLEVGNIGGSAGLMALFAVFIIAPIQSVSLTIILISNYFIFSMASSYAVKKVANRLLNDKGEVLLYPLIDKALDKVISDTSVADKQNWMQKGFDFSLVQMQIVNNIKNQSENKWIKKMLVYGFKKLSVDDIPFNDPKLNLREIIKDRVINAIREMASPSKKKFWYMILFHWIAVLVILIMNLI